MAGWRRVVELAMTCEEIERLTALSRSRTEPASRVSRAQMLLAYRENPSFCAVGQRVGVHHQTVQRCVERALGYGPLAAIEDRPRPGKEPVITPEAKAWLVSLACDKAKEHGYPHELWTTRLLARHAREHGPTAGHECLARLVQGHGVQDPRPGGNQAAQGSLLSGTSRCRVRAEDGRGSVRLSRGPGSERAAAKSSNAIKRVAIVSYDEKPEIQAIATTAPDLPPKPGVHATFARDYEYKRHGTLSLLAEIDLLTGKVRALRQGPPPQPRVHRIPQVSRRRLSGQHRDQADPRQSFRAHIERNKSLARRSTAWTLRVYLHAQAWFVAQSHRGLLLQFARSVLRHIRVTSKHELKQRIMAGIDDVNRHPVIHTWSYKLADAA